MPWARRQCYRARWVFPIDSPPLEHGVVEIEAGRITAVHRHSVPMQSIWEHRPPPRLGELSRSPGISSLLTPITPPSPFHPWILRGCLSPSEPSPPYPLWAGGNPDSAGLSLVGEIATCDWPLDLPSQQSTSPPSPELIVFRECLGRTPDQQQTQLAIARPNRANTAGSTITPGLSPHAPYSVHPDLLRDLMTLAVSHRRPRGHASGGDAARTRTPELRHGGLCHNASSVRSSLSEGLFPGDNSPFAIVYWNLPVLFRAGDSWQLSDC